MFRSLSQRAFGRLRATVDALETRLSRVEGHQQRYQDETERHLRRVDAVNEDVVAALDVLRRRIEALESTDDR